MKLNQSVLESIQASVLCWVATNDPDGTPNVSPKEMFCAYETDFILVANIASPVTLRNLRNDNRICISFVDVFQQTGFKIKGTATVFGQETPEFRTFGCKLIEKAGPLFPVRDIFQITPLKVARIRAPSFTLIPERTDEERAKQAYQVYGVRPVED